MLNGQVEKGIRNRTQRSRTKLGNSRYVVFCSSNPEYLLKLALGDTEDNVPVH